MQKVKPEQVASNLLREALSKATTWSPQVLSRFTVLKKQCEAAKVDLVKLLNTPIRPGVTHLEQAIAEQNTFAIAGLCSIAPAGLYCSGKVKILSNPPICLLLRKMPDSNFTILAHFSPDFPLAIGPSQGAEFSKVGKVTLLDPKGGWWFEGQSKDTWSLRGEGSLHLHDGLTLTGNFASEGVATLQVLNRPEHAKGKFTEKLNTSPSDETKNLLFSAIDDRGQTLTVTVQSRQLQQGVLGETQISKSTADEFYAHLEPSLQQPEVSKSASSRKLSPRSSERTPKGGDDLAESVKPSKKHLLDE
jgi:hypothetical protein